MLSPVLSQYRWVHYRGGGDGPREVINQGLLKEILRKGTR